LSWWNGPGNVTEFHTVADILAMTSREAHGTEAVGSPDRMFLSPDDNDFRLRPDAPGHRAGLPLPADVAAAVGVAPGRKPDAGTLAAPRR
jgi:hypothetical protein